jgi:hypothetical protein
MSKADLSPFLFDNTLTKKYRNCMLFGNLNPVYRNLEIEVRSTQCVVTLEGRDLPFIFGSSHGTEAVIKWFFKKNIINEERYTYALSKIERIKKALKLKVPLKPKPGDRRYCKPCFR